MSLPSKLLFTLLAAASLLGAMAGLAALSWLPEDGAASPGLLLGTWFAGLVLLSLIAWLLVSSWTRRVARIARAANAVARGALEQQVPSGEAGELGQLAAALDLLRSRVAARIAAQSQQLELLDSVLGGVTEGVLLVDREGRVGLANDAMRAIIATVHDPTGRRLAEVYRHPDFLEAVGRVLRRGQQQRERMIERHG
ncbi:MAG: HAMP domain-containing protein, partial [Acidobacteriota bacterium]